MIKSAFFLKPMDEGLPADTQYIAIPEGKTTIGRGPFLGCSEKRVSRNHAVLEVKNGELLITPTHVNPCFYYERGILDPLVVLARGDPQKLDPGDQFALLPESSRYEVGMEAGANIHKSRENGDVSKDLETTQQPDTLKAAPSLKLNSSITEDEAVIKKDPDILASREADASLHDNKLPKEKASVRTLPKWMLEADGDDSDTKQIPVAKKTPPKPKKPIEKPKQLPHYADYFPVLSSEEDEKSDTPSAQSEKGVKKKLPVARTHDISDDDTTDEPKTVGEDRTTASKRKGTEIDNELETKKRKPCEFRKKCYRKNPSHFKECSHPGDDDYASDEEEENEDKDGESDSDRPECEFGTDCYRKNPKHRKEYKHSKRPQRKAAREAKRKTTTGDKDSGDDSYESSFLDDDDSNGDSSYSPDDEDLRTLKKEAKEFTRNKKMYQMKS